MIETNSVCNLVRDVAAEKYVIGSIIIDNTAYNSVSAILNDDCFVDSTCRKLWQLVTILVKEGSPIDMISVTSKANSDKFKLPPTEIVDICSHIASTVHLEYHALHLLDLSRRRRLWKVGNEIMKIGYTEDIDTAEAKQKAIEGINDAFCKVDGITTLSDALVSLNDIIKLNMSNNHVTTGTPTGFDAIDIKGGLHKSDLIIVAGETSQGKTSLALTITSSAISADAKVAFYSMEMTKEQLAARLLASKTKIPANSILYGNNLTTFDLENIDKARGELKSENLYFDDCSSSNIDTILMSIRTMKMQSDIDGAVVDYLQILSVNAKGNGYSREQIMGDAARRFKNLAKELNIWIIALSQLSRDNNNPEPNLNRLRDSGQIAEASDIVMLVYRAEYYNRTYPSPYDNLDEYPTDGTAMIDVAKGRNIGTFKFFLGFDKNTASFYKSDRIQNGSSYIEPIEEDAPF